MTAPCAGYSGFARRIPKRRDLLQAHGSRCRHGDMAQGVQYAKTTARSATTRPRAGRSYRQSNYPEKRCSRRLSLDLDLERTVQTDYCSIPYPWPDPMRVRKMMSKQREVADI
jgi:hypothetical protein